MGEIELLKRRAGRIAAVMAIVSFVAVTGASTAQARNYVVDTIADTSSANACTLRDALNAAGGNPTSGTSCDKADPGGDTINFAPGLAGKTIALTKSLPFVLEGGPLTIAGPAGGLTIDGNFSGGGQDPILEVARAITISNLTFVGAKSGALRLFEPDSVNTVKDCTFANLGGTAIQAFGGELIISGSTFTDDVTQFSGIVQASGRVTISKSTFSGSVGSAVHTDGEALTITDSTISAGHGLGVVTTARSVTIEGSTFHGNANDGLLNSEGTALVNNSVFTRNGGGIGNTGTLRVTNSTFSDNDGSGINSDGSGSAVGADVTVFNSTFSGNAGAIVNTNGLLDADFCTFADNNKRAQPTLNTYENMSKFTGTILRGGILVGSQNCGVPFPPRRYVDHGYNIASDASCFGGGTSMNNTDPLLDPAGLKDNGGPTPTIALQATSPASEGVPRLNCYTDAPSVKLLTTDQRGFGRPAASHQTACSVGAYEFGAIASPARRPGSPVPLPPWPKPLKVPALPSFLR